MNSLKQVKFELQNESGTVISGDIRYPSEKQGLPAVFILHGFKGFKDWGFLPYVSERIAEAGAVAVSFNFSYNGMEGTSDIVKYPDNFAGNTIGRQLADALRVVGEFPGYAPQEVTAIWNGSKALLGHSLGGAISILTAARHGNIDRIALWGAISTFDWYSERQKKEWKKKGFMEFVNMKTGQTLRLNKSYLDDYEANRENYDLLKTLSGLAKPLLIVHGGQDLTVPVRESATLAAAYLSGEGKTGKALTKRIIENTGHTFGINHPFETSNIFLDEAINCTLEFIGLA